MDVQNGIAEIVLINVGGKHYQTSVETFAKLPRRCFRQAHDFLCQCKGETRQFFVDRDSTFFGYILNYFRTGDLHLPRGVCGLAMQKELQFWELDESCIAPCCWKTYLEADREIKMRQRIEKELSNDSGLPFQEREGSVHVVGKCQRVLWEFLDDLNSSRPAKVWGAVYHVMLVISVIISFLGNFSPFTTPTPYKVFSEEIDGTTSNITMATTSLLTQGHSVQQVDLPEPFSLDLFEQNGILNTTDQWVMNSTGIFSSSNSSKETSNITKFILGTRPLLAFRIIDYTCLGFFILEFVVRFCVCPNKKTLLFSPITVLDLSYIGSWMIMLFIFYGFPNILVEASGYKIYACLQALAAIRILRIFRLARYFRGLKMILLTLKASCRELGLLLICFLIAMVLFADLIRKAEHRVDEVSKFDNMFVALWWVVITMTTVGYGDVFPQSPTGYAVGMACAFLGPIITSFIVPMISDHFLSYYAYKERDIRRPHTNHSNKCV